VTIHDLTKYPFNVYVAENRNVVIGALAMMGTPLRARDVVISIEFENDYLRIQGAILKPQQVFLVSGWELGEYADRVRAMVSCRFRGGGSFEDCSLIL
jgi:hypothetical protein